ncbi:transcriptional regulator [Candidatus Gracilibacteria bacterium]|nr:transcriptional regulator [Candidatus Gracilibacteria bacterium]
MRADRLLAMMMLLQTRGKMTAQSLADKLEVSRRTICAILMLYLRLVCRFMRKGGHGGGIALDEHYRTTLAGMQEKEVRTLFVSDNTSLLNEIGLGSAAASMLLKLRAVLPAAHQPSVEHMRQRVLIDPVWWWRDPQPLPWWDDLQHAVYEDQCIRAVYERHNSEVIERLLEPYSLVAKSSVWYLIARHAGALRTYRVVRFRQITLLDTHFHRQADFDLPTYWHKQLRQFGELTAEYRFTLRVHPERMNFLQEVVPGRYSELEPADSSGWITVHIQLDSLDFAKMLVFGLAEYAIVVEPQELQKVIVTTARAMLSKQNRRGRTATSNANDSEIGICLSRGTQHPRCRTTRRCTGHLYAG